MSQSKWENVKVFVSGGGANFPYIENIFSEPWWKNLDAKYPVSRLPVPYDFDNRESGAPFERMTVAYGLSYPKPLLEKYELPSNVPDSPPPRPIIRNIPDRDELYPK